MVAQNLAGVDFCHLPCAKVLISLANDLNKQPHKSKVSEWYACNVKDGEDFPFLQLLNNLLNVEVTNKLDLHMKRKTNIKNGNYEVQSGEAVISPIHKFGYRC